MSTTATQHEILARPHKIAGVTRMVEDDRDCIDVLLQVASAQAVLGEASKLVLRSHVETGVSAALASGRPAERKQKSDELVQVLSHHGCFAGT